MTLGGNTVERTKKTISQSVSGAATIATPIRDTHRQMRGIRGVTSSSSMIPRHSVHRRAVLSALLQFLRHVGGEVGQNAIGASSLEADQTLHHGLVRVE